jgi:hypothetical protein
MFLQELLAATFCRARFFRLIEKCDAGLLDDEHASPDSSRLAQDVLQPAVDTTITPHELGATTGALNQDGDGQRSILWRRRQIENDIALEAVARVMTLEASPLDRFDGFGHALVPQAENRYGYETSLPPRIFLILGFPPDCHSSGGAMDSSLRAECQNL